MAIEGMNHFNVLTDDVAATRHFYCDILGMREGDRPPFGFDGLWLYVGGRPILHVSARKLATVRDGVIDHIAFTANDLAGTVAMLDGHGIRYTLGQQAGTRIWQLFCSDPMGARVELDFAPDERPPAGR